MSSGVSALEPGGRTERPLTSYGIRFVSPRKAMSWACCLAGRKGRLQGDRLTLDFCCFGLGEGSEVAAEAGPESPGTRWTEILIHFPISSPFRTRARGCPVWPPLPPILPPAGSFPKMNHGGLPSLPLTCPGTAATH